MNLLATPGLGSLMAGRIAEGIGQLVLAVVGFSLVFIWFLQTMARYYGQAFGEETTHHPLVLTPLLSGGGLFALAWVWSLFTSLSLMNRAKAEEVSTLKTFAASAVRLDEAGIQSALATVPHWRRSDQVLTRTFAFTEFVAAMKFVNAVAGFAEAAQHGPDIDIRWDKVTLTLTTHDAGGLTEKDFAFARQCDTLV